MPELVATFTTSVGTWQCDENDHLNVQFYSEFAEEASASLLTMLGLGRRAQMRAGIAIGAAQDHIRYLREFLLTDPVEVKSAPLEVGERHLAVYHEVRNPFDDTLAATIRRRIESDRPWPADFRLRAEAACVDLPAAARPRSVGARTLPELTLADAAAAGLVEVSRTVVKPSECDRNGLLLPRHQTARYSDGAIVLWRHAGFDRASMQANREGSVVIEMMQHNRGAIGAGDVCVVMSGVAGFTDKVLNLVHYTFDGETGTAAACAEATAVKFDQKIRKIMVFTDQERARLGERVVRL